MIYHERLSKMSNEELIKEARQHAEDAEAGKATGNYVLYRQLANALEGAELYKEYYRGLGFVEGITFTPKEDK